MKLISWNVNGIRAAVRKGADAALAGLDADVICLQEVRATPEQFSLSLPGYDAVIYPAQRKGYSGTAVLSREPLRDVRLGLGDPELDTEGRVITADLGDFYLVTVYTPNAGRELVRLDYRVGRWDPAFRRYVAGLAGKKPVVFCGDLNVAHKEIDLANPDRNRRNAGFTDEERASFSQLLEAGFVDTFRMFCQEGGHYTWWSNFGKARERNVGWRIDYFCVSNDFTNHVARSDIHPDILGSDHCPVSVELL